MFFLFFIICFGASFYLFFFIKIVKFLRNSYKVNRWECVVFSYFFMSDCVCLEIVFLDKSNVYL